MSESLKAFCIALVSFSIGVIVAPCEVTTVSPLPREDLANTLKEETLIQYIHAIPFTV